MYCGDSYWCFAAIWAAENVMASVRLCGRILGVFRAVFGAESFICKSALHLLSHHFPPFHHAFPPAFPPLPPFPAPRPPLFTFSSSPSIVLESLAAMLTFVLCPSPTSPELQLCQSEVDPPQLQTSWLLLSQPTKSRWQSCVLLRGQPKSLAKRTQRMRRVTTKVQRRKQPKRYGI